MEYTSADEGKRVKIGYSSAAEEKRSKIGYSSADEGNFGFGFNDIAFSDRVLRLEIIRALASDMNSGGEKYLNWFSSLDANDSECGTDFKVKVLHINSLVLASKSPFLHKLFKNGMKESQLRSDVTLRINASEETALMDLRNFIYGNAMSATSAPDLVDVMMAADKFGVTSCMRYCVDSLLELPMSTESALFYLDLPSTILENEVVQPLIDTAKQYLAAQYRDFTVLQEEEVMALTLSAIEVVIGSDGLIVDSEDDVFDFILKWARLHYPELEERREILTKHLVHFICFPNMSSLKLKEVLDCSDFDHDEVVKLVLKALFSKVEHIHDSKDVATTECGFPRRVYSVRPVKVVAFKFLQPCCVVYLDLKREECEDLFPSKELCSQNFCLGGRELFLVANCTLEVEYAVMKKPSKQFQIYNPVGICTLTDMEMTKGISLFEWTDLMSDGSEYFIDGILHLRVQLAIKN